MATRSITVSTMDENNNAQSFKISNVNPTATDANMYQAVQDIMTLSENTFISATVTDSYELTAPTNASNASFNKSFVRR